jgi:hypothetical protein
LVHEVDRLRAELARVRSLPALPEMEASRKLLQVAASLARQGLGEEAVRIRDAVDGWKVHASRERAGES